LRVVATAPHHDRLTAPYVRAALGSRDVYIASPNQDFCLIVRVNRDPEAGIAPTGMNGQIGSVDFNVRFAVFQYRVISQSASELNLNLGAAQTGNVGFSILVETQNVGVVELNFCARATARRNAVSRDDRRVEGRIPPVTGVSALRGDVTMDQTDARNTRFFFRRLRLDRLILRRFRLDRFILRWFRLHRPIFHLGASQAGNQYQKSCQACYQSDFHRSPHQLRQIFGLNKAREGPKQIVNYVFVFNDLLRSA
jgi:hypothetical protein